MKDGRKSFRAISRELKVSSPTVKARYERLITIGLVKSVRPVIDLSKVDSRKKDKLFGEEMVRQLKNQGKHVHVKLDNLRVRMQCEYCGGPINARPKVLKFASFQRFFCCASCKTQYGQKHAGRIDSIVEQYKDMQKQEKRIALSNEKVG